MAVNDSNEPMFKITPRLPSERRHARLKSISIIDLERDM